LASLSRHTRIGAIECVVDLARGPGGHGDGERVRGCDLPAVPVRTVDLEDRGPDRRVQAAGLEPVQDEVRTRLKEQVDDVGLNDRPVRTSARRGQSCVAPSGGLPHYGPVDLRNAGTIQVCDRGIGEHPAVEEEPVRQVRKPHAVLCVGLEFVMDAAFAQTADVPRIPVLQGVLRVPAVESPSAFRGIAMRRIPVLVRPVPVQGIPMGQDLRDEVVDVQHPAQGVIPGRVCGIRGHGVGRTDHGIESGRGTATAARAVVDHVAGVVPQAVILVLLAAEHLGRPGVVRTVVDVVHPPVQPIDIEVGKEAVRRVASHGIVKVCCELVLEVIGVRVL